MYLGIDIGTSAVKVVMVDDDQRERASGSAPLGLSRPTPLWSEQDPEDWWAAVAAAVGQVRRAASRDFGRVAAIGLSGQMHGLVLLDNQGTPLRPAILHDDGRSFAEAAALNRAVPDLGRIAGVPAMPGFVSSKLLWMKAHEPGTLAKARHLLMPKDYIRFRLTGGFVTDMCDAAGSGLFDCAARHWSPAIVAACGIDPALLPVAQEGPTVSGQLDAGAASDLGLRPGLPVATGTGDAAAGAIGAGAVTAGDAFISLGTAAQYFITREKHDPAPEQLIHSFCHGLPGRWFQMAALLNGAGCLAWVAGIVGESDIGRLLAETEARFAGPSPVIFLPYLAGERTPHGNPHARGVFFGMSGATTATDLVQAVLEGVALSLADCQAILARNGPLPEAVAVTGGGSRSRFWMRLLASALHRTILLQEGSETGPAHGAARLARLSVTGEDPAAVCMKPAIAGQIRPEPELVEAYADRLVRFRALYRALEGQF